MSEAVLKKRQAAIDEAYESQWDGGKGSHHPDYDPTAGLGAVKATREMEELLNAIIKVRPRRWGRGGGPPRSPDAPLPRAASRTTSAWSTRRLRRART